MADWDPTKILDLLLGIKNQMRRIDFREFSKNLQEDNGSTKTMGPCWFLSLDIQHRAIDVQLHDAPGATNPVSLNKIQNNSVFIAPSTGQPSASCA